MVDVDHRYNAQFNPTGSDWQSVTRPSSLVSSRNVCFSFAAYARNVIDHLSKCHVPISKGLTDDEFLRVESTFGFLFPPDLRSILQEGLPVGAGFPNWRSGLEQQLCMMVNLPKIGLCYEIARGRFWWREWGSQPADTNAALQIARRALKKCPTLVPIYSHCYIPCLPNVAGNPVFFVYEKDIFYCGYDLADFFQREPFVPLHYIVIPANSPTDSVDANDVAFDLQRGLENGGGKCKQLGKDFGSLMQEDRESQTMRRRRGRGEYDLHSSRRAFAEKRNAEAAVLGWMLESPDRWETCGYSRGGKAEDLEGLARKSAAERPLEPLERPETLVKSAGNSPRMGHGVMSRYTYFHDKPLTHKIITQFTIAAPPWAAKTPRHIDFWSDLLEGQLYFYGTLRGNLFPAANVDVDLAWSSEKETGSKDEATVASAEGARCCKRWLSGALEGMAKRLREGGWREDDIAEMVDAVLPADDEQDQRTLSGQGLLEAVAMNMEILSELLRKAGWSAQDVLEVLHFDLATLKRKRAAPKLSPQLFSKMGKLSESLEQA